MNVCMNVNTQHNTKVTEVLEDFTFTLVTAPYSEPGSSSKCLEKFATHQTNPKFWTRTL